jgi:uncharacterized RDD family membrane protein YckC
VTTSHVKPDRDLGLQGHHAGIVTRVVAFGIDVLLSSALFAIGGRVIEFVLSSVLGKDVSLSDAPVAASVGLATWLLLYFAYPVAVSGRTLGMALVGLEVISKDGGGVSAGRALVRTLVLPISVILLGLGILTILVDRNRRALHDMVAGTVVVYSWNARAARLRFLAREAPSAR